MKTIFKQFIATLLTSLLAVSAFAETNNTALLQQLKDSIDINFHQEHLKKINKGYLVSQNAAINRANKQLGRSEQRSLSPSSSAAEPLYYLEIMSIASEHYPYWEDISPNDFATVQDHGGSFVYVVTLEGGYAEPYSRKMKINGSNLTKMYSEPVYDNANTLIGWLYIWGTTSYTTGGLATYEATSTNYPWNTMLDRLTIQ